MTKVKAGVWLGGVLIAFAGVADYVSRHQTPFCLLSGHCLPDYNNHEICKGLSLGRSRVELIYKLGEPIREAGRTLFFDSGAHGTTPIEVRLDESQHAVSIDCGGSPQEALSKPGIVVSGRS